MKYRYNNSTKSYDAELNVTDKVECNSTKPNRTISCVNNMFHGLSECEIFTVHINHNSCSSYKELKLEVPPGKYPLISICIFTKTVQLFVVCFLAATGISQVREQG